MSLASWAKWSAVYDSFWRDLPSESEVVFIQSQLPSEAVVIDMGAGTGRVSIPLLRLNVTNRVVAIDNSRPMLDVLESKLKAEPGCVDRCTILEVDMAQAELDRFHPNFIWFGLSSFFSLLSPESQIECLRNCANALAPDGKVGFSLYVPNDDLVPPGDTIRVRDIGQDSVTLTAMRNLPGDHILEYREVWFSDNALPRVLSEKQRYLMPSEIDAMAADVGLQLSVRYGDFEMSVFDEDCTSHVSVYSKLA